MYSSNSAYRVARSALLQQGVHAFTATTHGTSAVIEDLWSETTTPRGSLGEAMDDATQWNEDRLSALQNAMDMYVVTQVRMGTAEELIVYGADPIDIRNDAQVQATNTRTPCTIYCLHADPGSMSFSGPTSFNPYPRIFVETVQPR